MPVASPLAPVAKRTATRNRAKAKRSQAGAPKPLVGQSLPLTDQLVKLVQSPGADAAERHAALEVLRTATPEQREAVCPAGLAGKARKRFIADGVTVRTDVAIAQQQRKLAAALTNAKETTVPATKPATKRTRTRKAADTPTTTRTAKRADTPAVTVVTASSIAKDNDLDATAFRKWLRSEDLRGTERDAAFADTRKRKALVKRFVKAAAAAA